MDVPFMIVTWWLLRNWHYFVLGLIPILLLWEYLIAPVMAIMWICYMIGNFVA